MTKIGPSRIYKTGVSVPAKRAGENLYHRPAIKPQGNARCDGERSEKRQSMIAVMTTGAASVRSSSFYLIRPRPVISTANTSGPGRWAKAGTAPASGEKNSAKRNSSGHTQGCQAGAAPRLRCQRQTQYTCSGRGALCWHRPWWRCLSRLRWRENAGRGILRFHLPGALCATPIKRAKVQDRSTNRKRENHR